MYDSVKDVSINATELRRLRDEVASLEAKDRRQMRELTKLRAQSQSALIMQEKVDASQNHLRRVTESVERMQKDEVGIACAARSH